MANEVAVGTVETSNSKKPSAGAITTDNKGNVVPVTPPASGLKGVASVLEFKALITDSKTMTEAAKVGQLIMESKRDKDTTDGFVSAMVAAGKGVLTSKKQCQTAIELLLSLQGVSRGSNPDRWDYVIGKLVVPEVLARLGIVTEDKPKTEKSIAQIVARLAKGRTQAQMVDMVNACLVFCPPEFSEAVGKVLKEHNTGKAKIKAKAEAVKA